MGASSDIVKLVVSEHCHNFNFFLQGSYSGVGFKELLESVLLTSAFHNFAAGVSYMKCRTTFALVK